MPVGSLVTGRKWTFTIPWSWPSWPARGRLKFRHLAWAECGTISWPCCTWTTCRHCLSLCNAKSVWRSTGSRRPFRKWRRCRRRPARKVQERDTRLITGFARTPCFEVSRRLLWRDKRIETYTRACIAVIDSTGLAESVVSIDRVPTQKKYALDKNSCSRPSL